MTEHTDAIGIIANLFQHDEGGRRPSHEIFPHTPCQARHFASWTLPCTCAAFCFCDLHALVRDVRPARLTAGHATTGSTDHRTRPEKRRVGKECVSACRSR